MIKVLKIVVLNKAIHLECSVGVHGFRGTLIIPCAPVPDKRIAEVAAELRKELLKGVKK